MVDFGREYNMEHLSQVEDYSILDSGGNFVWWTLVEGIIGNI